MSGIEAVGLVAQVTLLFIFDNKPYSVLKDFCRDARVYHDRYGTLTGLALITLFAPDAPRVIHWIESSVLQNASPDEVKEFMTLLASGFNMIGVAVSSRSLVAVKLVLTWSGCHPFSSRGHWNQF